MKERLIYEGRFLVNMAGAIIRQDSLRPVGRMDWEKTFRTADYHRIANITYLGILGNTDRIPERWKDRFFERYQEAMQYNEVCMDAEKEILTLLDMREISCTILTSCGARSLYQLPETAANSPLQLYMDDNNYVLAKGYLVDLGYETDRTYAGFGERMRRVSGFYVEIYHHLPFRTHLYEKFEHRLLERAYIRKDSQHIRTLSLEDRFTLRLAEACYLYVTDDLKIRNLMDIYLYYSIWRGEMNWEYIGKRMIELNVDELAKKLLHLSCMWFGTKDDVNTLERPEDMSVFDVLENRILSRGNIGHETDTQAIALARLIEKEEHKESKKERRESQRKKREERRKSFLRHLRWIFPEYHYMCSIYAFLEKYPFLLPFCWIVRGLRLLFGLLIPRSRKKP